MSTQTDRGPVRDDPHMRVAHSRPRSALPSAPPPAAPALIFLSGEPDTPGHQYRIVRHAAAAQMLGLGAEIMTAADVQQKRPAIARAAARRTG